MNKSSGTATLLIILAVGCAPESPAKLPAAGSLAARDTMEPFKCEIDLLVQEEALHFTTYFCDQHAIEFDPSDPQRAATVFDLKSMWWTDVETGQSVSIQECEEWAEASTLTSRKSIAESTDQRLKDFVNRSLEPDFTVLADDETVTLKNDLLSYRVSHPISLDPLRRKRFFAYDRLNAYRKAMTERKHAPFPQLAVDAELERRGFVPGLIELEIRTPDGELELQLKLQVADLTEAETKRVRNAIQSVARNAAK